MKTLETTRSYNCKDEELTVMCRYALYGLKRDLVDFAALSPVFNERYVQTFADRIEIAEELISPKTETEELKIITKRMYQTMDGMTEHIDKIRVYLRLAKDAVPVSAKDFGLTLLSRKIARRDAEGVRQNLLIVKNFLKKYSTQLNDVGFNDTVIELFANAAASVTEDNQKQFDIIAKRKEIVRNNLKTLNELYIQLMEVLNTGKMLYKNSDPIKAKEYVFNTLKKSVRV
jgi:hypothetical protein